MGLVWCERGNGVGGRVGLAVVCVCVWSPCIKMGIVGGGSVTISSLPPS